MPETSRGYPYPAGSDAPNVTADLAALAAAVNTDVGAVANPTFGQWVPALTASTTSPTLGTSNVRTGWFVRIGDLVAAHFYIQFGTSGTSAGSGLYQVSLPYTAAISIGGPGVEANATGRVYNISSTTVHNVNWIIPDYDPTILVGYGPSAINDSFIAWAASDHMTGTIVYRAEAE